MSDDAFPLAYFISFTCYGTWLHGEEKGSVDDEHNVPDTPFLPPSFELRQEEQGLMDQAPYHLDEKRRQIVLDAIIEVCWHRKWTLHAAHIRTNHLHVVVSAKAAPERVMNDFKVYASRSLNNKVVDSAGRKRWSRHGSTRYLWKDSHVAGAVDYVLNRQGEPMAVHPTDGCH
jgi:REP element-mobilizing transposase RayT